MIIFLKVFNRISPIFQSVYPWSTRMLLGNLPMVIKSPYYTYYQHIIHKFYIVYVNNIIHTCCPLYRCTCMLCLSNVTRMCISYIQALHSVYKYSMAMLPVHVYLYANQLQKLAFYENQFQIMYCTCM